jgi:ABC-type amino acid transport substrate-binding protein
MRRLLWGILIAALLAVACQPAATPTPAPGAGAQLPNLGGRELKIASDTTYPPFEFVDSKTNEVVGFDVDLVNEICKLLNCKPKIISTAWEGIFAGPGAEAVRPGRLRHHHHRGAQAEVRLLRFLPPLRPGGAGPG